MPDWVDYAWCLVCCAVIVHWVAVARTLESPPPIPRMSSSSESCPTRSPKEKTNAFTRRLTELKVLLYEIGLKNDSGKRVVHSYVDARDANEVAAALRAMGVRVAMDHESLTSDTIEGDETYIGSYDVTLKW